MDLKIIHAGLANSITYYFFAMGIWALLRYVRKEGLDSSYWGALAIGAILPVVQGLIGAYQWITFGIPPARGWFHVLYGFVAIISIPAIYTYTKGQETRRELIVYAPAMIFAAFIAIRAIATG